MNSADARFAVSTDAMVAHELGWCIDTKYYDYSHAQYDYCSYRGDHYDCPDSEDGRDW